MTQPQLVKGLIDNITFDKIGNFFVIDKNGTELVRSSDTKMNETLKPFEYFESFKYDRTQLNVTNQTVISELDNRLILSKPISFKGGNLIAILVPENK